MNKKIIFALMFFGFKVITRKSGLIFTQIRRKYKTYFFILYLFFCFFSRLYARKHETDLKADSPK